MILDNLGEGFVEAFNWGMVVYQVPLEIEPDTYNGQPLMYIALAAQKRHLSLYMMDLYQDSKKRKILDDAFAKMAVKPNMGKCCLRFNKVEKIPLQVIGQLIAETPIEKFLQTHNRGRSSTVS